MISDLTQKELKEFTGKKFRNYPIHEEVYEKLNEIIYSYPKMANTDMVGILEMIKFDLLMIGRNDD